MLVAQTEALGVRLLPALQPSRSPVERGRIGPALAQRHHGDGAAEPTSGGRQAHSTNTVLLAHMNWARTTEPQASQRSTDSTSKGTPAGIS